MKFRRVGERRFDRDLQPVKTTDDIIRERNEERMAALRKHYGFDGVKASALGESLRDEERARHRKRLGLDPAPRNARERIFGRTK